MRTITRPLAVVACAALAACASSGAATQGGTVAQPGATQTGATGGGAVTGGTPNPSVASNGGWTGTLMPMNASGVGGTVTVRPAGDAQNQTTLMITGGAVGSVMPWHIHTGSCAQPGGIVGPPTAYTAVAAGADGAGTVVVTLPFAAPTSGTYSVNVHKSPSEMSTYVACADLRAM